MVYTLIHIYIPHYNVFKQYIINCLYVTFLFSAVLFIEFVAPCTKAIRDFFRIPFVTDTISDIVRKFYITNSVRLMI